MPRKAADADDTVEVIDVIEADRAILHSAAADEPGPPRRRWPIALAVALLPAAALVVVARPWGRAASWRVFPAATVTPTVASELRLADPPSPLVSVFHGTDESVEGAPGYRFAAPGARPGSGRWAAFVVEDDPHVDDDPNTASTPRAAALMEVANGATQLSWTRDGEQRWAVTTHGLSGAETRAFADAVGVRDGAPALRASYSLGDLRPSSSIAASESVRQLLTSLGQGAPAPAVSVARYRSVGTPTAVATVAAPSDAVAAVRFTLGGADTTVHGQPAIVGSAAALGRFVAWWQGGRLVMVTGSVGPLALLLRAEAVREATPATLEPDLPDRPLAVPVGSGTTADGHTWSVTAHFGLTTAMCVTVDAGGTRPSCDADAHATLPHAMYVSTSVGTIVVELSNSRDREVVRLSHVAGDMTLLPLRPLIWDLTATAFLPAPGDGFTLLDTSR